MHPISTMGIEERADAWKDLGGRLPDQDGPPTNTEPGEDLGGGASDRGSDAEVIDLAARRDARGDHPPRQLSDTVVRTGLASIARIRRSLAELEEARAENLDWHALSSSARHGGAR